MAKLDPHRPIKTRKPGKGWVLLVEVCVPPDGCAHHWSAPAMGSISFANGEALLGLTVIKKLSRVQHYGVVRLYRSVRGYPKFRLSRNVKVDAIWVDRTRNLPRWKDDE